ncbi:glycosyltransferase [Krasilnikoviella flava]|uniref:Poly(Glycerol-phosphate) alpha-glucosyltransferase n=1 Tax=Krasilnikoviella flava TaxID=526729 RepID=A0A1T5I9X3_9MICO|nr:glycosyltransferase [Krasilnikoviella flava]SKC35975.1 poly(glycerol-phosphate) alpha-glucosyltransferase [Krasilnikoviella flava]
MPHSHGPTTPLPAGSHAAATWTIPADYGGMTSALLRRSRAFVQEAGVPVRILTFSPDLDLEAARRILEERGELVPGLTLHNVWHDLRLLPDDVVAPPPGSRPATRPRAEPGELVRTETAPDGEVLRQLHFRADGTLAAVDERAGRRITLYSRDGRPGRRWTSAWSLYRYWLDGVLPERPGYVIVDSKTMVKFFASLQRKDLYTAHLVHGAHLSAKATDAHGPLTAARTPLVEHLDDYDAMVFLTDGQRRDVVDRVGERAHTYVVPNSTDLPDGPVPAHEDRLRGAVLASLHGRKRVGQAVAGIERARRRSGLDLTLDVYGDGPERDRVAARAAKVPGVTLHGFVRGAADRLADTSFLLLTSRAEGLPLVFAEAMSRGCVPIAYDIRYGPADIITDGTDGFLVPDGDVDALAAAVERFVTLDDDAVRRMREAAVVTAQRYSDAAVVARWANVLEDVTRRHPQPAARRPSASRPRRRATRQTLRARLAGMLRRAPR